MYPSVAKVRNIFGPGVGSCGRRFFGREGDEPILVRGSTYIETVAKSPALYLMCEGIARPTPRYASPKRYASPSPYREHSSYPAEEKSVLLVKGKAPSRSGILLSMHVDLKTRHVNPNIHVRRY